MFTNFAIDLKTCSTQLFLNIVLDDDQYYTFLSLNIDPLRVEGLWFEELSFYMLDDIGNFETVSYLDKVCNNTIVKIMICKFLSIINW